MKPILVLYATREGQTRRIAEHIAATIHAHGVDAQILDVARPAGSIDFNAYEAIVIAASVHARRHEREMVHFVKQHSRELAQHPTVFLSTSLTEAGAEDRTRSELERARAHAAAKYTMEEFFLKTGFRPTTFKPVAGALHYTKYNWLVRLLMKRIAKHEGGSTDTSHDHEYTDWVDLDRFVGSLLRTGFRQQAARGPH